VSQRKQFTKYLAQTSHSPLGLEVASAKGAYITDTKGDSYFDLISGISVCSLGHNHPKIIAAAKQQMDEHMHVMVYGEYIQTPQVELAILLSSTLPSTLDSSYL